MREVSLAVLDIAQNSVDAGAKLVEISVEIHKDGLTFEVRDDGVGMDGETLAVATKKGVSFKGSTGLGLALLKEEVEGTGGKVTINSEKYVGTAVKAEYVGLPNEIPIGNLGATYVTLVDDGYDVKLDIIVFGTKISYDSREYKSSSCTAVLQSSGALRLIREDINKFIRQIGGAML